MKATIVIPSYWGRPSAEGHREGDSVYDHPTPLDREGTLGRALESISILDNRNFNVVVLAAATAPDIAPRVEERVKDIVSSFESRFPVTCVSHSFEKKIIEHINRCSTPVAGRPGEKLVSLTGYSNIRNMCMIVAELARSEIAVLFDDDEVYEDADYLDNVFESMDSDYRGRTVGALAGYYLRPEGGYLIPPPEDYWLSEWPMAWAMNSAFSIIGEEPRLKPTPFVFGGNMCVHRDVFRSIAFDPNVRRGEDIDYLTNCKFFDIDFLLDNRLSILHLPPDKHMLTPWVQFRENIYRFVYAREKIRCQKPREGMRMVSAEELDPYPGECMKDNLEDLVFKTSVLMGLEYMRRGDADGYTESMRNIQLARYHAAPAYDPYAWYLEFREDWVRMMEFLSSDERLSEEMLASMRR